MKKLIFGILAILLLGGIVFLYLNRSQKNNLTTSQPTPTSGNLSDKAIVSEITSNFYNNYDSCLKNPPAQAAGKVSEYCQNNTGVTSATFEENLAKGGTAKAGADPIVCAQNLPESVAVNPDTQIIDDKAVAFVSERFGSTQIKIQVILVKENGSWLIDNIICPVVK